MIFIDKEALLLSRMLLKTELIQLVLNEDATVNIEIINLEKFYESDMDSKSITDIIKVIYDKP